jgi:hypothetical protein
MMIRQSRQDSVDDKTVKTRFLQSALDARHVPARLLPRPQRLRPQAPLVFLFVDAILDMQPIPNTAFRVSLAVSYARDATSSIDTTFLLS